MRFLSSTLGWKKTMMIAGCAIIALEQGCAAAQNSAPFETTLIAEKLEAYFRDYVEPQDPFMASISLSIQGEEIFNYQLGLALEGVKADDQTQYRIGSISKTFTSTMILQLIEQDLLALDTKLASFYPQLPNADNITIEQLLKHQSGLQSLTDVDSYWDYQLVGVTKAEQLERFVSDEFSPVFPPGTQNQYSNTNYVLLGYIVEDVTGMSYAEYLDEYIVTPLGLSRTEVMQPASADKNVAISFTVPRWTVFPNETHTSVPGGAGNIMSTPSDLVQFYRGLLHIKDNTNGDNNTESGSLLLSASSIAAMTNSTTEGYGMGVFVGLWEEDWIGIEHGGAIDNFESLAVYFPAQDVCIAYIVNGVGDVDLERDPLADIFSILVEPEVFQVPMAPSSTSDPSSNDEIKEDGIEVEESTDVADMKSGSGGSFSFSLFFVGVLFSFLV